MINFPTKNNVIREHLYLKLSLGFQGICRYNRFCREQSAGESAALRTAEVPKATKLVASDKERSKPSPGTGHVTSVPFLFFFGGGRDGPNPGFFWWDVFCFVFLFALLFWDG